MSAAPGNSVREAEAATPRVARTVHRADQQIFEGLNETRRS